MFHKPRHLGDLAPGTNLMPIPFSMALAAMLLFAVTLSIDAAARRGTFVLPVWLSVGNIDDARVLLSAFLGAVSTVLALIFSVSLLVFSMAATQFGPRLMYRFLRDRVMQMTIGLFVATFIFCVLALIIVRQKPDEVIVPQVTVLTTCLLVLASFGFLIVFNHRVALSIQTANVLPQIVEDLQRALDEHLSAISAQARWIDTPLLLPAAIRVPDLPALNASCQAEGAAVRSATSGYVQRIRREPLLRAAEHAGVVVRLCIRPGQFVGEGDAIAHVLPAAAVPAIGDRVARAIDLGRNRTLEQDLEFAIAQLVEIALRALSPAINDMYTGLYCIDWLGDAVRTFAAVQEADGTSRSADGVVHVMIPPLQFAHVVKGAFDSVRHASSGSPSVKIRLFDAWTRLGPHLRSDARRAPVMDQVAALWDAASQESMAAADREDIRVAYESAINALRSS